MFYCLVNMQEEQPGILLKAIALGKIERDDPFHCQHYDRAPFNFSRAASCPKSIHVGMHVLGSVDLEI